ncbi:EAL domain-containing protein [Microseira sp. BLCC-F43]|jgi:diguanylate cyclase (GGDEF)-like protein/PAS domain S-box-containing protein|uniref:sensor domain-containing protein n=1 Tax=Microseira sp. BLCC-F43 TaxID=3153602 RepID=UPI0035BA6260
MNAREVQEEYGTERIENYEPCVIELKSYSCKGIKCSKVENRLQTTLKELSDIKYALDQAAIIAISDPHGIINYVNDKFCVISGYSREELLGQSFTLLNSGYHSREFFQHLWLTISQGQVWQGEIKDRAKDGRDYWVSSTVVPFLNEQGRPLQYLTIQFEITERKLAEAALRESKNQYQTLVNLSPVGIFCTDALGQYIQVNDRWCQLNGVEVREAMGEGWVRTIHPEDRVRVLTEWYQAVAKNLSFQSCEYRILRPDGTVVWVIAQATAETGRSGSTIGYVGAIADITERKQVEEQLRHYAWHDALTGLPNRALFLRRLEAAIASVKQYPRRLFAVLFLDLDRLKLINDSMGHLAGDRLLVAFAERLTSCLRPSDTVARLGGDEFTILLENISEVRDVTFVAERIVKAIAHPFYIEGHEIFASASIGIVLSGSPRASVTNNLIAAHDEPTHVLRDADTAMYCVKQQRTLTGYAVFNPKMYDRALESLQLENDLRKAVENRREFTLQYQPIFSLVTGRISGFEALLRWQHPQRGQLLPGEFIPLAEDTGLIVPLGRWVLAQAALQMRIWQLAFPTAQPLIVSVNLSPKQFLHPGLVQQIDKIIWETGLNGNCLKLEITESTLIDDSEETALMLQQLRQRQIGLCIDDFGTGYSSLSHLTRFPLNTLKIDRSFVSQIGKQSHNAAILWTIVNLAHNLGMDVIAEGVETALQLEQLKKLKCEQVQGNYLSPPVDANAAGLLLAAGRKQRMEYQD